MRSAFSSLSLSLSLSLRERAGGEGGFIGRCSEIKGKVKSYPLTPALSPRGARGKGSSTELLPGLAAAHDRDVVLGPAAIRHKLAAFSLRGFPEGDLVELVETVGLATFSAEQFALLARRRHRWQ
jgi:hypothetical protein